MADDLLAKVQLADGCTVWRDGGGRYRDVVSGRFVARAVVEGESAAEDDEQPLATRAKQSARVRVMDRVQQRGHAAVSAEDAWGELVGVQAEIALDSDNGSKATAAAKLVAQATGMLDAPEDGAAEGTGREGEDFLLGRELARQLVSLIEEERTRRGWPDEHGWDAAA